MTPQRPTPEFPPRPTALAHALLLDVICAGDLVIDATAGNGHDTVFLAQRVGAKGRVLAFDVQAAAITTARERVASAGMLDRVEFFQTSHALIGDHAEDGSVAAIMFNLGYLPGADHLVMTTADSTLAALTNSARLLKPGGVLTSVCYPGHPGGEAESAAVEHWFSRLAAPSWRVARYGALGTSRPAPFLLMAAREA